MLWKTWSTKGADGVHLSKKGKNIFSERFAKIVKRAFKELIEREISVNPPPASLMSGPARDALSLERVDRLVGDHLKSSTWPFHYLCLLQFVKFQHHGVFFLLVLPKTKSIQRQDVPGEKQMGTGLFLTNPGTLFTTSFPMLCLALLKFLQARERGLLVT